MNLNHNMPLNVWTIVIRLSNSIYSFFDVQFNLFHIYLYSIHAHQLIWFSSIHMHIFFFCSCKCKLSTKHHHFFLTHQLKNVAKNYIWKSYFYRAIIGQRHEICFIFIMACVYVSIDIFMAKRGFFCVDS